MGEALLSLALVALVLGLLAQIFVSLSRQDRGLQQRELQINTALGALETWARECRMAVAWTTPATNQPGLFTLAEFDVPDYEQDALRLPLVPSTLPNPPWNPESRMIRLRYRLDQGRLLREVRVSGAFESLALGRDFTGISLQRVTRQDLQLELSLFIDGQVRSLRQRFRLPCPHTWRSP